MTPHRERDVRILKKKMATNLEKSLKSDLKPVLSNILFLGGFSFFNYY